MKKYYLGLLLFLVTSCSNAQVSFKTSSLYFNNETIKAFQNKTYSLNYFKYKNFSSDEIELSSSNESILFINEDLTITAKGVGEAILNLNLKNNPSVSDQLKVKVDNSPLAYGIYNYSNVGDDKDKTFELYHDLEKYVINNHLMGVPLYGFKDYIRQKYFSKDLFNFVKLYVNACSDDVRNVVYDIDGFDGMPEYLEKRLPYTTKPILQNESFYDGLIACINREELANKNHANGETLAKLVSFDRYNLVPIGYDYTSSIWDYEKMGKLENYSLLDYVNSEYYKDNFKGILDGTDEYGYSFEKASGLFSKAANELISQGLYTINDNVELGILISENDLSYFPMKDLHLIKDYIEKAFNDATDKLNITINIETTPYSVESLSIYGAFDMAICLNSFYDIDDFKAFSSFKYSDVRKSAFPPLNTFCDSYCNDNYSENQMEISFNGERFTYSAICHSLIYARGDEFDTGTLVKDGLLYSLLIP